MNKEELFRKVKTSQEMTMAELFSVISLNFAYQRTDTTLTFTSTLT